MIFLDASFIVAYVNSKDQNHNAALRVAREIDSGVHGPQAVSEYVLDEAMTVLLARTKDYSLTISEGETLRKYVFIKSDEVLLENTWSIFSKQNEPYLSFTDCNTIAVCEMEGIAKLATFDKALAEKSGLLVVR